MATSRTGTTAGRTTHTFRRLAATLRSEQRPCWLCGQDIDYEAERDDPDSFTVDHIHPLSTHPHLAEDYANLAAAHKRCNSARGNKAPRPGLGLRSREW